MINKNLLKAKIVERGFTQTQVRKIMGLADNTFSFKVNGKKEFFNDEIQQLQQILKLSNDELLSIFYPNEEEGSATENEQGR